MLYGLFTVSRVKVSTDIWVENLTKIILQSNVEV